MNSSLYKTLLICLVIFGCDTLKEKTVEGVFPDSCISPSDAIVKFERHNEERLADAIIDYAKSRNIEFTNAEEQEVENWIYNTVFSNKRGNAMIKEWNINDDDICFTQSTNINSSQGDDSIEIKICNTILTRDVSAGDQWRTDSKNFSIDLKYCFRVLEHIGSVGYYEVIENNNRLERSLKTDLQKYYSVVDVHLQFYDKKSNTELNKLVLSDNGFLYTDVRDLD